MVELRENEIRILAALDKLNRKASVEQLMEVCELPDTAVMRAALILQENNLVKIHAEPQTKIKLTPEGASHAQNGLPERRIINAVLALGGKATLTQAAQHAALQPQFSQIALGWTQRKRWATFDSKTGTLTVVAEPPEGNDEQLLSQLKGEASKLSLLPVQLQAAVDDLKKRKAIVVEEKTDRVLELTAEGAEAIEGGAADLMVGKKEITQLTPDLIIKGTWRDARFKNTTSKHQSRTFGLAKSIHTWRFLRKCVLSWLHLGSKKWRELLRSCRSLILTPLHTQDHPARELDGIYYLNEPKLAT
jgi:phenylalanyl-tRNA synthetase alpha chain